MELKIDPEFHKLIPPLTPEEYTGLESSILAEGCRDAIMQWNGIIVDGHNRYEICQKHNLNFKIAFKSFKDHDEAKEWIIKNQLSRRNLSAFIRIELELKVEEIVKRLRIEKSLDQIFDLETENPNIKIAELTNTSHATVSKARQIIKKAPESLKQSIRDGEITISRAYNTIIQEERNEKEKLMKESLEEIPLPEKKYSVIVIDPPWEIQKIIREVRPNQKELDYPTMTIDEIKAMPISDLADRVCTLFIWTIDKYLFQAKDILEHWGFQYHITMAWDKGNGMSMYGFNRQTEFVLVGFKGTHDAYPERKTIRTSFTGKSPFHSAKPDEFYDMLQVLDGNKIDVFARKQREGWDVYGNEIV